MSDSQIINWRICGTDLTVQVFKVFCTQYLCGKTEIFRQNKNTDISLQTLSPVLWNKVGLYRETRLHSKKEKEMKLTGCWSLCCRCLFFCFTDGRLSQSDLPLCLSTLRPLSRGGLLVQSGRGLRSGDGGGRWRRTSAVRRSLPGNEPDPDSAGFEGAYHVIDTVCDAVLKWQSSCSISIQDQSHDWGSATLMDELHGHK